MAPRATRRCRRRLSRPGVGHAWLRRYDRRAVGAARTARPLMRTSWEAAPHWRGQARRRSTPRERSTKPSRQARGLHLVAALPTEVLDGPLQVAKPLHDLKKLVCVGVSADPVRVVPNPPRVTSRSLLGMRSVSDLRSSRSVARPLDADLSEAVIGLVAVG
jgi:hypothetical protein